MHNWTICQNWTFSLIPRNTSKQWSFTLLQCFPLLTQTCQMRVYQISVCRNCCNIWILHNLAIVYLVWWFSAAELSTDCPSLHTPQGHLSPPRGLSLHWLLPPPKMTCTTNNSLINTRIKHHYLNITIEWIDI